ncbi:hypothetical protein [Ferrimicrobium acidiphilum]|uniref:Uncharacterized protein n=1 Tax=Ferrimicrobium acidiphilum DSM 19497 TaxID=1121877 RepID=A0A0D8FYR8_9ACTN|nr:hypothetical protein [Ferrimicrobium acidiphilum]KJE77747.1 hypothetical protein FEAC_04950 [Ferrimicrobium acidiphilum DSM 19497]
MAALNPVVTILVDCATRPGRVLARRHGVDASRVVGDRPLGELAAAVADLAGDEPIDLLALVTGPGPLLPLRSAAAFVRLLAWSQGIRVVSFRSIDPIADQLVGQLAIGQRGLILEPIGRKKILRVEVRRGQAHPIERASVVAGTDLELGHEDLVTGQLREEGRIRGASILDKELHSDAELLDFAVALWRRGAFTVPSELRVWYVKESGVRRGFDVRLADGSIGRVGLEQ